VVGRTELDAEDLLAVLKALEHRQGRRQDQRDAPRPLDIDLLLHGEQTCHRPELTLPHPRLRQRRFALAPLVDLAPDLPLPPDGRSAASVLGQLEVETGGHAEPVPWPPTLDPSRRDPG
jgi:7,8-dihydro-6-hydroxymethylpterin-pyrophosphokinase